MLDRIKKRILSLPVWPGCFGWRASHLVLLIENPHEPGMDGCDLCVDPWVAGPPTSLSPAHNTQQLEVGPCPLLADCATTTTIQIRMFRKKTTLENFLSYVNKTKN